MEPPTVPGEALFWDTTTTNNLYGFQIGADGKLFERGRLVRGVGRVVVNRPIGELHPNRPSKLFGTGVKLNFSRPTSPTNECGVAVCVS